MGILTTRDSARSFSTYVALFGLALLISSASYLKTLNKWAENHSCAKTLPENADQFSGEILCYKYNTWRQAAIIGIVIGVVDVLVVPFLLCCGCCLVCGCTALFCACMKCQSHSSSNSNAGNATQHQTSSPSNDNEMTQTTTPAAPTTPTSPAVPTTPTVPTTTDDTDSVSKFSLSNLPKPVMMILNVIGWTVWVLLPFVGTLMIVIWIGEYDAIRTRNDDLYGSALSVFVIALLNLMVFYQKFIDSVCEHFCGSKDKKEKKTAEPSEV